MANTGAITSVGMGTGAMGKSVMMGIQMLMMGVVISVRLKRILAAQGQWGLCRSVSIISVPSLCFIGVKGCSMRIPQC